MANGKEDVMRWCVMQSLKYNKWVLAVMNDDATGYEVTSVMSDYVEKIIQYADYLNLGKGEAKLDAKELEKLEKLRLEKQMALISAPHVQRHDTDHPR